MSKIQFADQPCVLCGKPGAAVVSDPGILMRSTLDDATGPWRRVKVGDVVCTNHVAQGYNSRYVNLN